MNVIGTLAKVFEPSPGFPLLHGDVGWLDEIALILCIVVVAVAVFGFYFSELRKSKDKK